MHAEQTSLRTAVTILARLFQDFITGRGIDSVLNGPTSKVWIDHWLSYLEATAADQFPVGLRPDTRVESFIFDEASGRICGLQLANGEHVLDEEAIYIAAVPVEAMVQILKNGPASLLEHSPTLKLLFDDFLKVNRMSGILYYLKSDSPTARGHILYLDSSWALTSISQNQFWSRKLDSYGKGQMHGVVSAIISDWFADGNGGVWSKTAQEADNEDEIVDEALAQIRAHIVAREGIGLEQANIGGHFLDPALKFAKIRERLLGLMSAADFIRRVTQIQQEAGKDKIKSKSIAFVAGNVEPLFINTVGSWLYRPTEATDIENLFLASDYVRTNTDLATMEGANESGRRAVNRILSLLRVPGRRCRVFRFDEPAVFAPLKALDERCFRLGLPHPSLMFGCP